jgi:hypothetical protein
MTDDALKAVEREAAQLHAIAPWLQITPTREPGGKITVHVALVGGFEADPDDLAGSVIREIHRRIDDFEGHLDE